MGRCPRRYRDLPVRRGRARVDVLRRAGRRCRCARHGGRAAARGDGNPRRDGHGELRQILPGAGLPAQARLREPDRPAPGRHMPQERHGAIRRSSNIQAIRGPVRVLVVDPADDTARRGRACRGSAATDRGPRGIAPPISAGRRPSSSGGHQGRAERDACDPADRASAKPAVVAEAPRVAAQPGLLHSAADRSPTSAVPPQNLQSYSPERCERSSRLRWTRSPPTNLGSS